MDYIVGLIGASPGVLPPNNPPEWTSTPDITFAPSASATYNLSQDTFDQEGDTLIYVKTAGSFPTGISLSSAGIITATSAVVEAITSGFTITVDDGVAAVVSSPAFNITVTDVTAWPAQDAWAGVIPSVRNRNGAGVVAAGRGFGAGGADGSAGRHAYSSFNVGTQTGTTPAIIHVTNRNASGTGSLREAWTTSGPRIIVFDVGGRFPLDTLSMNMDNDECWVAGQSAPSQVLFDMTTSGKNMRIRASNVFVQHVIFWCSALPEFPGQDNGNNDNALIVSGNGVQSNLVLANCMFGGGTDQVLTFYQDFDNITAIDSLICCARGKDPLESVASNFHQFNWTIGGNGDNENANFVSLIGCCSMDGAERNPSAVLDKFAAVNFLVYNASTKYVDCRGKTSETLDSSYNVVGVYAKRGPQHGGQHPVSVGRGNGAQDFGSGTNLHVSDTRAVEYSTDEIT